MWLPTLMGPKPSSIELYLRNRESPHSFTPSNYATELAGRKIYWHSRNGFNPANGDTGFNAEFEVVSAEQEFDFDVFFDSVTEYEVNALVYALTLGNAFLDNANDDGLCFHKIGHGKPAGLGSVLII